MEEYEKIKNRILNKKTVNFERTNTNLNEGKNAEKNEISFRNEIENIKNEILKDISECNIKQAKDIIILIDFNVYDQESNNNISKVEAFIDQTKTILNNYLSSNDRAGVFIFTNQYKIVCPLMSKKEIDNNNFYQDLIDFKQNFFKEKGYLQDDKNINENDLLIKKMDFQLNEENSSEQGSQDDSEGEYQKTNNFKKIECLLKSINYIKTYLKMKEGVKNEKYIIFFTDLFN